MTHSIEHQVDTDGCIFLHGLPLPRGHRVTIIYEGTADQAPPQRPTWEQIQAQREKMRGSVVEADDYDPSEPACDPLEWSANREDSDDPIVS